MHKLYILATPIGNIKEANQLLIETLESLPILFCEDTRVTKNLLNILKIKNQPKLISLHKYNEHEKNDLAIEYLTTNDCGLVSDAGYPTISDPGYNLVNACHEHNIQVNVINGSCAINHALVQSGMCSHGYTFIGFIPKKEQEIINILNKYIQYDLPVVFFVSVHQVNEVVEILKKHFSNHYIYIGRELTKKFEQYQIRLAKDLLPQIEKGEFCFILDTLKVSDKQEDLKDFERFTTDLELMLASGIKLKDACKYLAKKNNLQNNTIYNYFAKKMA